MSGFNSEGRIKAPCKGCEKRSENCHGICEAYKEFVDLHEKERRENHERRRKYNLGYGAHWRTEKEFAQTVMEERKRNARTFRQHKK